VSEQRPVVLAKLTRLEAAGFIEPVDQQPFVVSPLKAVDKDGGAKIRRALDYSASGVTTHDAPQGAFPSVRDAVRSLEPGSWRFKLDPSDGFLHLPVRPDQVDLLGLFHPTQKHDFRRR
jgi:hypothetical protein